MWVSERKGQSGELSFFQYIRENVFLLNHPTMNAPSFHKNKNSKETYEELKGEKNNSNFFSGIFVSFPNYPTIATPSFQGKNVRKHTRNLKKTKKKFFF